MSPPLIPNASARGLFLERQGLAGPPAKKLTNAALLGLIDRLGFVQVDSINTVERAHHQILFSRNQTYRQDQLRRLHERDAAVFENWTHDAAIIPTAFYPYWRPKFAREATRLKDRWRKWRRDGFEDMLEGVLRQVASDGPLMARDLGDGEKKSNGGWWDWHPSKTALEFHWRTGGLAVARREGFQKVYDLTERVIPGTHRRHEPDVAAFIDWACRGALDRLGFASSGELAAFWALVTPDEAKRWCRDRLASGEVVEVAIVPADGGKPRAAHAWPDLPDRLADIPAPPSRVRVLSPFDPLLRDRARAQRLFGFDYRIEIFVPEAKRRYGYYVFPLLQGDRLIGRVDMKHERQSGVLRIKGLWLEPGVRQSRGRMDAIAAELDRVRRFTAADRMTFDDGYLR